MIFCIAVCLEFRFSGLMWGNYFYLLEVTSNFIEPRFLSKYESPAFRYPEH